MLWSGALSVSASLKVTIDLMQAHSFFACRDNYLYDMHSWVSGVRHLHRNTDCEGGAQTGHHVRFSFTVQSEPQSRSCCMHALTMNKAFDLQREL